MKEVIEKAISSLAIAAFIPSAAFVLVALIFFMPVVPPGFLYNIKWIFDTPALFVLLMTAIIGFTLLNLKSLIYRLYRGYYIVEHIPLFNRLERRHAERLSREINELKVQLDNLAQVNILEIDNKQDRLESDLYRKRALEYETFPSADEEIESTRFGNILRAAEVHPADCYGIDAVSIWPRLVQCLPTEQYEKIEQAITRWHFQSIVRYWPWFYLRRVF
jgi:hypothetical protein